MDSNYDWLKKWSLDTFDGGELEICFTEHNAWLITLTFNKLSTLYCEGFAEHYPRVMINRGEKDWVHASIQYDPQAKDVYPTSYYVECSPNNLDAGIGVLRQFVVDMQKERRAFILEEANKLTQVKA